MKPHASVWRSSVLILALALTSPSGCAWSPKSSQIRVPERPRGMSAEWPLLEACCPRTADYLVEVLEARCDQIAERGEPAPKECR